MNYFAGVDVGASTTKTVIIDKNKEILGYSVVDSGADFESAAEKAFAEAKKQGILVIGAHIEGTDRRIMGASPGDNSDELSIDAVCPKSDLILVRKDGNVDGRFTTISKNNKIPMIEFEKMNELPAVLNSLFKKK